jgi:hypothetical protein
MCERLNWLLTGIVSDNQFSDCDSTAGSCVRKNQAVNRCLVNLLRIQVVLGSISYPETDYLDWDLSGVSPGRTQQILGQNRNTCT